MPGTLNAGVKPDPYNSLKALFDRKLRKKVIEANRAESDLEDVHIDGSGHEFWVDETTGFTAEEQEALIKYLLSITEPDEKMTQP
ncbi:hypothetical protein [Bacillus sp. FJAT-45350]|uniref:hypothetical protein n=1 Tax=Bacillus sp. FJAT-45350 TaxID=2011014 RepID=UPI000BB7B2A9|nr:hypothetical protein [Bacillus sp. FJAT-45350]